MMVSHFGSVHEDWRVYEVNVFDATVNSKVGSNRFIEWTNRRLSSFIHFALTISKARLFTKFFEFFT